ncbi:hypothetical protein CANCADRAFT_2610 [Tortispora caseinolytica NRRL Y-17796]|uniref:Tetrapyrrole biosynthesis uroporphyrinogen III synthase domain-containing protein n=1 Tax=Tortispora caseinolytica NRRL Y-17796 TaxID=767744 RepID=A0A1E4TGN7_9ASCO|nr:hypothetical protein CANCADRAFT_2610 [Tortispora caseinolytica NRRL Y-17796]
MRKRIVLLKSQPNGEVDPYASLEPHYISVLKTYNLNADRLHEVLDYNSFIFTSARAVEALKGSNVLSHLISKPVYVVGQHTASALREIGHNDIRGEESGRGEVLASIIADHYRDGKVHGPMMFLSAETTAYDLAGRLCDEGIETMKLIVYKTEPDPQSASMLSYHLDQHPDEKMILIVFSPSGVSNCIPVIRAHSNRLHITCIGPSTEKALLRHGLSVEATAESPDPEGMTAALRQKGLLN